MKKEIYLRRFILLFSFLIFSTMLYAGGALSSPRKVYVVNIKHFEIIFPKESVQTADYIAQNADSLYEKAKESVGLQNDFVMPIIISPDSSVLEVKYTNRPYNRIVIFDAIAKPTDSGEDLLLTLLYKEIFRAVSASVRSPFNEFIHKYILGDYYQPAAFVNLPFSFSEAYADIATACPNDSYFQQLLIQAKMEGKFPTWLQASANRDIHPGNDLNYAAGTAFAAFLMQSRGLEKYSEFWNECGKLHPYFMNGIFYKIYGKPLFEVWKEFEDSVPLPEDFISGKMQELESLSREVSENDCQGAFENILYTNYGIVWYDSIRHEVDIFDSNSIFKIRQLLFIADDISKLSLSPDGRYVSASFIRGTSRPEFKEDVTCVFDLKERRFLEQKLPLRDAAFIMGADQLCLAGIAAKEKKPVVEVYSLNLEKKTSEKIYEKEFERTNPLHSLSAAGEGKFAYLLSNGLFVIEDIRTGQSQTWTLSDKDGSRLYPISLQFMKSASAFTFSYYPETEGTLARSAYITFTETEGSLELQQLFLQTCDISGGVYYPVIANGNLYYCARKFSHNELRYLNMSRVPFEEGAVAVEVTVEVAAEVAVEEPSLFDEATQQERTSQDTRPLFSPSEKRLGDFDLKLYNPFKYLLNISYTPLLAIRDITIEGGPVYWPSLGLNICADSDPLRNTELVLSGGIDFLILSFEKEFNTVPKETQERFNQIFGKIKKYSFSAYLENSSTPVDISAGALFNFNKGGDYDFKGVAKTAWTIPVGNILRDMQFTIGTIYSSSTDYYDENKIDYHPPMEGWTPLNEAYQLMEVSFAMTYSNSHQYGISKYERRGLTLGARLYSFWDIYEINLLNKYRDETRQQIQEGKNTELTEVQLENLYKENLMNISQLNLGLTALIEIPRLTPLEIYKGWVLSVPATLRAELMNKAGSALDASVEALLIGNEVQNGIPFLYLYFSRIGLKGGYNLKLDYDTTKVQLPDVRRENYLADVFSQTYVSDSIFMILNTDFLIPTGKLSEIQFNMDLRGEYYIKTKGFKISLNVNAVF